MKTTVGHFGVHWREDIAFLIQEGDVQNALDLRLDCPFEIKTRISCEHQIPLTAGAPAEAHLTFWNRIKDDPLVDIMSPVPRQDPRPAFLVGDATDKVLLATLTRLSSPITVPIIPTWMARDQPRLLTTTNVQTLVVTDATISDKRSIDRLGQQAATSPRALLVVGEPRMVLSGDYRRITTNLRNEDLVDLTARPWELLGAWALRQHMLNGGA